jgi:hypothetical protein
VEQAGGVEIGLRGKVRFANTFNSLGNGDYVFSPGTSTPGNALWNFDWSINVDHDGANPGRVMNSLTYRLDMDYDPSAATNFQSFDPINVTLADHSFGDNSTPNGGGTEAANAAGYLSLITDPNVNLAQNSWNLGFFDTTPAPPFSFDPNATGIYTIALTAFNGVNPVASSKINIIVAVPEPAAFLFGGLVCGVIGVGLVGKRLKNKLFARA